MGQRLVVQLVKNDKLLATGYYHWSGYTFSGLAIAGLMLEARAKLVKGLTPRQQAVRMLQGTGATLWLGDYNFVFGRPFTFSDAGLTEEAIVLFTKLGIEENWFAVEDWDKKRFKLTDEEKKWNPKPKKADYERIFKGRQLSSVIERLSKHLGFDEKDKENSLSNIYKKEYTIPNFPYLTQKEKFVFAKGYLKLIRDRNVGMINVTKPTMEDHIGWSELDLALDITCDTVQIGQLFWGGMTKKDYSKEWGIKMKDLNKKLVPWIKDDALDLAGLDNFLANYSYDDIFIDSDGFIVAPIG